MTNSKTYNLVAIIVHWLTALAVLTLIVMGLTMNNTTDKHLQFVLFQWHKSIGITVLLLSLFRLAWRLTHRPPPLPVEMPDWEKRIAVAVHYLFYGFLIGLPLTGWATVSASPYNIPTVLYGLIPWPHLPILPDMTNKAAVEHVLGNIHSVAAWILTALVGLHAAAAIRHHVLLKDDVLIRMAPFVPSPGRD